MNKPHTGPKKWMNQKRSPEEQCEQQARQKHNPEKQHEQKSKRKHEQEQKDARAKTAEQEQEQEQEHQRDLERIAAFRPIDDTFMRCLFDRSETLVQEVLRIITGIDDLVVDSIETQKDMKGLSQAHSLELDVWAHDASGKIYNIEVEKSEGGANPKRARYHSAAIDTNTLAPSKKFTTLPETYVIFITETDLFKDGIGFHHFIRSDGSTTLDDGTHIIYVWAGYNGGRTQLKDLMHDFLCSSPRDMHTPLLAERASYLKEKPEGINTMCKIIEEMKEEALAKGVEIGRAEGQQSYAAELRKLGVSEDLLAKAAAAAG